MNYEYFMKITPPVLILQEKTPRSASRNKGCAIRARASQKKLHQRGFIINNMSAEGQNKDGVLKKYSYYSLRS
jgi:hypothetical protein